MIKKYINNRLFLIIIVVVWILSIFLIFKMKKLSKWISDDIEDEQDDIKDSSCEIIINKKSDTYHYIYGAIMILMLGVAFFMPKREKIIVQPLVLKNIDIIETRKELPKEIVTKTIDKKEELSEEIVTKTIDKKEELPIKLKNVTKTIIKNIDKKEELPKEENVDEVVENTSKGPFITTIKT
jgi:hypothetical protein